MASAHSNLDCVSRLVFSGSFQALFYGVAARLEAGADRPLIVRALLFRYRLLLCLLLRSLALCLPPPEQSATATHSGPNGRSLAGVTCNGAAKGAKRRPTGTASNHLSPRRALGTGLGCSHRRIRVEAGLLYRPGMTVTTIFRLLLLRLIFLRIDKEILLRVT